MLSQVQKKGCRLHEDDGVSHLGIINVGKYPLHDFTYDIIATVTVPIYIPFAGHDTWVKGCYRYREHSNTCALELVRSGTFRFFQHDQTYLATPGSIFIVHQGLDSTMEITTPRADKLTISLSGPLLPSLLETTGLNRCDLITPASIDDFVSLFEQVDELLRQRPEDVTRRGSVLAFDLLTRLAAEHRRDQVPPLISDIINYIDHHIDRRITVDELSHHFGLNRVSLHRLFVTHLQTSISNYLIAKRMEIAVNLLQISDYPIKEIAAKVGYSNQLYFSTEFRRIHGESPRAFRARKKILPTGPGPGFPEYDDPNISDPPFV